MKPSTEKEILETLKLILKEIEALNKSVIKVGKKVDEQTLHLT